MSNYKKYKSNGGYNYELYKTVNLNPKGKKNQEDGLYQVRRVMRPDLSDREILEVITRERIRRAEMELNGSVVDKVIKDNIPGYKPIKIGQKQNVEQILSTYSDYPIIMRIGKDSIACDPENGNIYTSLAELYAHTPVSVCWVKEN